MVGEFAGFPHEGFILQVFTCYLLVNVLKANEERPVTKPEQETSTNKQEICVTEQRLKSLICITKLSVVALIFQGYRGDCASAIHIRSMLQASRGS